MLEELLTRLPTEAGQRGLIVGLSVAAVGMVFWLAGGRLSRSTFTLVGVAAGAWLGLRIPRWMGWDIDAMAIAIGGALLLGFAGYLLHMMWVGITLGTLLAAVAALVTWHRLGAGAELSLPEIGASISLSEFARQLWNSLPGNTARVLVVVTTTALGVGGLIAAVWPKLGRVLTFSLLGSLLLVGGGLLAAQVVRPHWIDRIPSSAQTQGIALGTLVVLGAAIQWSLSPRASKASLKPGAADDSDLSLRARHKPRDLRDLGTSKLGPMRIKEARV